MGEEDWYIPGEYIAVTTGDIWERRENGKWYVNGMLHTVFPYALNPVQDVKKVVNNDCRE